MSLRDKILGGAFTVTGEITPHKGVDPSKIKATAELLRGSVDALNVTDNQRASVKASSLTVSKLLLEWGIEPVYQLTCRDRNRIALQSDLLGAHMLGIRNILAISGDHPSIGDHPGAKPVYDLDSTQLIEVLAGLNGGADMMGNKIDRDAEFFIGAALNPSAEDQEVELLKAKRKIDAGAQFFQTQVVYDVDAFRNFMAQMPKDVKVLAGIIPLKSEKMARFMLEKMPGVSIPPQIIREMGASANSAQTGADQAARIISEIRPHCDGVHIMALGSEERVGDILRQAGLRA